MLFLFVAQLAPSLLFSFAAPFPDPRYPSRLVVIGFYKVSYMFRPHALNRKQCEILGNASLSHPGAWKFCQKVDEEPPPLTDAREGLKTFVAKSLRKKLGAQLLMRAACRTYMYTLSPPEQNVK